MTSFYLKNIFMIKKCFYQNKKYMNKKKGVSIEEMHFFFLLGFNY